MGLFRALGLVRFIVESLAHVYSERALGLSASSALLPTVDGKILHDPKDLIPWELYVVLYYTWVTQDFFTISSMT